MYVFLRENVHFSINRRSKKMSVWASILEPTWLHFGFKNRPKSRKNRLRKGTKFSIDFGTDFSSIFGPFWGPRWGHVGALFAQEPPPEAPGGENPLKSAPPEPPPIFHRFSSSSKRAPGRLPEPSGAPPGAPRGASGAPPGGLRGVPGSPREVSGGFRSASLERLFHKCRAALKSSVCGLIFARRGPLL